ncbi:RedB protein [Tautonia sp. JC769]|uniref:RedB protein n=1 Tax=Tautonia sp. JC769 TaxID=3232135 RepID=UPI0034594297
MGRRWHRVAWLAAGGLAWLASVGWGFFLLEDHRATPGAIGSPPDRWPSQSAIAPEPGVPNLVVLAHPQCPCTRASIAELARLMARCPGKLAAHVVFIQPEGLEQAAGQSDIWRSAEAIPGVRVVADPEGLETARFGAATSGLALLFDEHGTLRYRGGITGSRGHEGANPGRDAVVDLARSGRSDRDRMPVFGCPLFNPPTGQPEGP